MPKRIIEGIEEMKSLVGSEIGSSEWFELTQERVNDFADATLDHQWIHIERERAARESPFGGTIAHGFLTLSLLPNLAAETFKVQGDFRMGINYGLNRLRFPSPVPVGSRLRARFALQSVEEVAGGYQVTLAVTVEVEGASKPALVAEWVTRYYS